MEYPEILQKTGFEIPYLAGGNFKHFHIVGTRSGGTIIAFWAIMKYLGREGFIKIVKECMDNTEYLINRINEIEGIQLAARPIMNVAGITTVNGKSVCELDTELRNRRWYLGKFLNFNLVRVVVMPHVKREHLARFCDDLEKVARLLKLTE